MEFREDIRYMELHRAFSDAERCGNFLVRETAHQQLQHLDLARRQRMTRWTPLVQQPPYLFDVDCQDFLWNPELACGNAADRRGQFCLPPLVKLEKAVYAPIKEPDLLRSVAAVR